VDGFLCSSSWYSIEINARTLVAYREEFAKKGLVITRSEDYPREDFYLVKKQKDFELTVKQSRQFFEGHLYCYSP
jgi:hypothetical protein